MGEETFIIVGLGNPGEKYAGTRHNVGFKVVDELAALSQSTLNVDKWESISARVRLFEKKVWLVKPQTFMNLSGKTVAGFVDFYKIPLDHLLIIHDDIDMKPGRIKLVAESGHGGHNGIRSLIQYLGTKDFLRMKIGIGRPGQGSTHSDMPVEHYVLAQFSKDELDLISERMEVMIRGINLFLHGDVAKAINLINSTKSP